MSEAMPRMRDAERTREAILQAAERLFAQHGFLGTSLEDIGREAGVSRGTPSYFFGSKDGLYRAVLERCFSEVSTVLREARERSAERGGGPEEALAREIEAYLDFLVAHPAYVRLVQWESLLGGETLREFAPHVTLVQEALSFVQEDVASDTFRPVDPIHLMLSIIGMCWYPLAENGGIMRVLGQDPYDADFVAARKQHILELVMNGLRRR
jgi:AcrR family transcriptional regulator